MHSLRMRLFFTGWAGPLCEGRLSKLAVSPAAPVTVPPRALRPGQWEFFLVSLEAGPRARCVKQRMHMHAQARVCLYACVCSSCVAYLSVFKCTHTRTLCVS